MVKLILKPLLRILGALLSILLLALIGLVLVLTITEYKPQARQAAEQVHWEENDTKAPTALTVYSWNVGYGGLGKDSDFFMDGGKLVNPPSQAAVEQNLTEIASFIQSTPADAWLLQEVDLDSARTNYENELRRFSDAYGGNYAFAYNYKCPFVPIPLPPIGKVESGIATLTQAAFLHAPERIALPCPFRWPVSAANLKRCLLVTRIPVEGSSQELVLVNLHLEAYDDGEGKIAQTRLLMEVLQEEYARGNYVIAGGDFNQTFPGALEAFPIQDSEKWTPGVLESDMLPHGWQFACDDSFATCRLLDRPYDESCQAYVIDGFILSPNVQLELVETVDLSFQNSDHNPVRLEVTLE